MANQVTPKTSTMTRTAPQASGVKSTNYNYRPMASLADAKNGGQAEELKNQQKPSVDPSMKEASKAKSPVIFMSLIDKIEALCDICAGTTIGDELVEGVGLKQPVSPEQAATRMLALLKKSSISGQAMVGRNKDIVNRIMTVVNGSTLNDILDLIYKFVKDSETLMVAIDKRFGVPVGSKRADIFDMYDVYSVKIDKALGDEPEKENDWTANGLIHVYSVYMNIPQQHLDLIRCLMTFNVNSLGGASAAYSSLGIYYVNYSEEHHGYRDGDLVTVTDEGESNNIGYSNGQEGDLCRGMVSIDKTIAHELGHIVDAKFGYSTQFDADGAPSPNSFLKYSKWRRHDPTNREKLVEYIISYIKEAYSSDADDGIQELTRNAAQIMLRDRATNDEKRKTAVYLAFDGQTGSSDAKTDKNERRELVKDEDGNIMAEAKEGAAVTKVANAPLLAHIQRAFADNTPWYSGERFDDMNRQIHEGYVGRYWYSYANDAWDNQKFSSYQFREPGEEFAEIYGSYFAAKPNGSRTPEHFKEWFEKQNLHLSNDGTKPNGNDKDEKIGTKPRLTMPKDIANVIDKSLMKLIDLLRRKGK